MFSSRAQQLASADGPGAQTSVPAAGRASRRIRNGLARIGGSLLVVAVVSMLVVNTTTPSFAFSPAGGIGIRAKSTYEQLVNPFGDEWTAKAGANPSIPNWLTPMCHRAPQVDNLPWPQADEIAFTAKSNSGILWEECGDPMEATPGGGSGRNGDLELKNYIAAVKAANPSVKYVGYRNLQAHSTTQLCANITPAGLLDFEAKEEYFLHIDGRPATKANRVKYDGSSANLAQCPAIGFAGNDVYDFTNPNFRQDLATHIKWSLDYHNMDGLVLDYCFDRPIIFGAGPSQAKLNAWEDGCVATLAALTAAMPNKLIYFTGYRHVGTAGGPSNANEEAAFQLYQRRLNVTNGFFWEDGLGPILGHENGLTAPVVRFIVSRYKRIRDAAAAQNKLMVNVIGTGVQRQTTFPTTDRAQQLRLARFYLAGHMILRSGLNSTDGLRNPFVMYTPTSVNVPSAENQSFASDTYFKDWDYNIGWALGDYTEPTEGVFVREFQEGRVVWNFTNATVPVDLTGSTFRTLDLTPVTSYNLTAFSGMIFLKPGAATIPVTPPDQVSCTPRPKVYTTVTRTSAGVLQVTISPSAGGGYLQSVQIDAPRNATVDFQGGQQGLSSAYTYQAASGATSAQFTLRRTGSGPYSVQMTVTDGCGTWKTFAGSGAG